MRLINADELKKHIRRCDDSATRATFDYVYEEDIDDDGEYYEEESDIPSSSRSNLSNIRRFKADYVEDMPEDDEGLLEILELAIRNARANLEMLESLYAALSPQTE